MPVVTCSLCGADVKTVKPVAPGTMMKCPDCGDEFEVLYDKGAVDAGDDQDEKDSWKAKKYDKSSKDDEEDDEK